MYQLFQKITTTYLLTTHHCHADNLSSTEQVTQTQPKQGKFLSLIFHHF